MNQMERTEKRKSRRVHFEMPVEGGVAKMPVTVVDVSTEGAQLEHPFPLTRGKQVVLEFVCDDERVSVRCEVIRCRLEKIREGQESRVVYRSGVHFVGDDQRSSETLWGIVAMSALDEAFIKTRDR